MEKYIIIEPNYLQFEELFKDFSRVLSYDRKLWKEYGEYCNLYTNIHYLDDMEWKNMMSDFHEPIELYKVSGECIGVHENVPYSVFLEALIDNGFGVPPFGTGLFIPLEIKKQNIIVPDCEEINVFSPIPPYGYGKHKSWFIKLRNVFTDYWPDGKITIDFNHLRPTETWISPKTIWVVQNISNK